MWWVQLNTVQIFWEGHNISHYSWNYLVMSTKLGDFFKILWYSQNIWTLQILDRTPRSSFQVNKYLNFKDFTFNSSFAFHFFLVSPFILSSESLFSLLWDFLNSKFYSEVFSLALDDDILEFSFQMRNILSCFLKKEIHYCLWLWLFDLRHNNVQTFSPHLLAKDQRTSPSV